MNKYSYTTVEVGSSDISAELKAYENMTQEELKKNMKFSNHGKPLGDVLSALMPEETLEGYRKEYAKLEKKYGGEEPNAG